MNIFIEAPAIAVLVEDLVDLHHPNLKRAHIRVLSSTKGKKKDGFDLIAWAVKCNPLTHYLSGTEYDDADDLHEDDGVDFVILVDADMWAWQKDDVKRRVLDRLLMGLRGRPGSWELVEHDFEGYFEELRRYGPTRPELQTMARALEQQELPLEVGSR